MIPKKVILYGHPLPELQRGIALGTYFSETEMYIYGLSGKAEMEFAFIIM